MPTTTTTPTITGTLTMSRVLRDQITDDAFRALSDVLLAALGCATGARFAAITSAQGVTFMPDGAPYDAAGSTETGDPHVDGARRALRELARDEAARRRTPCVAFQTHAGYAGVCALATWEVTRGTMSSGVAWSAIVEVPPPELPAIDNTVPDVMPDAPAVPAAPPTRLVLTNDRPPVIVERDGPAPRIPVAAGMGAPVRIFMAQRTSGGVAHWFGDIVSATTWQRLTYVHAVTYMDAETGAVDKAARHGYRVVEVVSPEQAQEREARREEVLDTARQVIGAAGFVPYAVDVSASAHRTRLANVLRGHYKYEDTEKIVDDARAFWLEVGGLVRGEILDVLAPAIVVALQDACAGEYDTDGRPIDTADDDDGCPVGDPSCTSRSDESHDACTAPPVWEVRDRMLTRDGVAVLAVCMLPPGEWGTHGTPERVDALFARIADLLNVHGEG